MAHSRKDEVRALDAAELELVDKSHHPAIQDLSDAELGDLVRLLRERRDRAQAAASRQRREMRGKSEPRGVRAAADDTGTRLKGEILAMAVRRLNSERDRRARIAAKADLADNARRALALRQSAGKPAAGGASATAHEGMRATGNSRARRITAPAKVGSVSQQNKNAQARRDSR